MKNKLFKKNRVLVLALWLTLINPIVSISETIDSHNSDQLEVATTLESTINTEEMIGTEQSESLSGESQSSLSEETSTEMSDSSAEETTETDLKIDNQGESVEINQYVTITQKNYQIWQDLQLVETLPDSELFNKTFHAKESISHQNGKTYYVIYNFKGEWQGYIDSDDVTVANGPEGILIEVANKYAAVVKSGYNIWENFDWLEKSNSKNVLNQTYQIKGYYNHANGERYYALHNLQGQWQGYINSSAMADRTGPQGNFISASNKYASVVKNGYKIWQDFNWQEKKTSSQVLNQTYHVKGYYKHANGEVYYSLYNLKGQWQGYINASAMKEAPGPQGNFIPATNHYATVVKNGYSIWQDFSWKERNTSNKAINQTYHVKGYYKHTNGEIYYSLYNLKGQWQGYINSSGMKDAPGPQGNFIPATKKYVTIVKNGYKIWQNFSWQERNISNKVINRTYHVKGYYKHTNGEIYYSLYDSKGQWQGYINANAAKSASGAQGIWLGTSQQVTVTSSSYKVWKNFSWAELTTSKKLLNKNFQVTGYYNHVNGDVYYSLYNDSGQWQGYINAKAVKVRNGTASYLNSSREKLVAELTKHQSDRFYLTTPYRSVSQSPHGIRCMSPKGAPNGYGPGMNCAGFVAIALQRSGANVSKIANNSKGWGDLSNAYNWRDVLLANSKYQSFNSVQDLLKSGKAKKGDLIYFEPDRSQANYDCHLGFFWGNTSQENKFWHSTYPSNKISTIYSATRYSKVYLFQLD